MALGVGRWCPGPSVLGCQDFLYANDGRQGAGEMQLCHVPLPVVPGC